MVINSLSKIFESLLNDATVERKSLSVQYVSKGVPRFSTVSLVDVNDYVATFSSTIELGRNQWIVLRLPNVERYIEKKKRGGVSQRILEATAVVRDIRLDQGEIGEFLIHAAFAGNYRIKADFS